MNDPGSEAADSLVARRVLGRVSDVSLEEAAVEGEGSAEALPRTGEPGQGETPKGDWWPEGQWVDSDGDDEN